MQTFREIEDIWICLQNVEPINNPHPSVPNWRENRQAFRENQKDQDLFIDRRSDKQSASKSVEKERKQACHFVKSARYNGAAILWSQFQSSSFHPPKHIWSQFQSIFFYHPQHIWSRRHPIRPRSARQFCRRYRSSNKMTKLVGQIYVADLCGKYGGKNSKSKSTTNRTKIWAPDPALEIGWLAGFQKNGDILQKTQPLENVTHFRILSLISGRLYMMTYALIYRQHRVKLWFI